LVLFVEVVRLCIDVAAGDGDWILPRAKIDAGLHKVDL
jgi:hypothetical protein